MSYIYHPYYYRAGQVAVSPLTTNLFVPFSTPFPVANYTTLLSTSGVTAIAFTLAAQNQTISGFSLGLSVGLAAGINVGYVCWLNN